MKPFIDSETKEAICEFCGEVIAKYENGKWINLTRPHGH